MKVNRALTPGPVLNSYTRTTGNSCFGVSEDSIPQTSSPTGTSLDRLTKADINTEPTTPYHGKMSTENAKAWHQALVATARDVETRYDELKAFGASSTFYLEDLSQSLTGEAEALRASRSTQLKLAGGALGLGFTAGATAAFFGHPIIGGIAAVAGCIGGGIWASDARELGKTADSTQLASRLVADWALIPAGSAPPAVAAPDPDPTSSSIP